MRKTTVKEYDIEGKLVKETVTEEDETPAISYLEPIIHYYPAYPAYPTVQPVAPWYDRTPRITW